MDLGLANYQPTDAGLGENLGCRWAHIMCDLTDGIPDIREQLDSMLYAGMQPIVDVRTSVAAIGNILTSGDDGMPRIADATNWFTERVLRFLATYLHVRHIEVWANAELAHIHQGHGMMLDYPTMLTDVHARVKAERPDVEVWTGGFGANCIGNFLTDGLARHCPKAFDVCNWHPFLSSCGTLEADVQTVQMRLGHARKVLDEQCAGQSMAASAFGIPTVTLRPPPEYGRFVRVAGHRSGGARAIHEDDAGAWYTGLLQVFSEAGFRVTCLLAQDLERQAVMHDWAGLKRLDGTLKHFVPDIIDWSKRCATRPEG